MPAGSGEQVGDLDHRIRRPERVHRAGFSIALQNRKVLAVRLAVDLKQSRLQVQYPELGDAVAGVEPLLGDAVEVQWRRSGSAG